MKKYKEEYHIINNIIYDYSKPNFNNRIYSKEIMEKAINDYKLKLLIKKRKEKIKKLNELS